MNVNRVEVDLSAVSYNFAYLSRLSPKGLVAVLKSDAYGHGAIEVGTHLESLGCKAFAVWSLQEGVLLRERGIVSPILLLGHC